MCIHVLSAEAHANSQFCSSQLRVVGSQPAQYAYKAGVIVSAKTNITSFWQENPQVEDPLGVLNKATVHNRYSTEL